MSYRFTPEFVKQHWLQQEVATNARIASLASQTTSNIEITELASLQQPHGTKKGEEDLCAFKYSWYTLMVSQGMRECLQIRTHPFNEVDDEALM